MSPEKFTAFIRSNEVTRLLAPAGQLPPKPRELELRYNTAFNVAYGLVSDVEPGEDYTDATSVVIVANTRPESDDAVVVVGPHKRIRTEQGDTLEVIHPSISIEDACALGRLAGSEEVDPAVELVIESMLQELILSGDGDVGPMNRSRTAYHDGEEGWTPFVTQTDARAQAVDEDWKMSVTNTSLTHYPAANAATMAGAADMPLRPWSGRQ